MSEPDPDPIAINQSYLITITGIVSLADVMSKMLISGSSYGEVRKEKKCDGLILSRGLLQVSSYPNSSRACAYNRAKSFTDPPSAATIREGSERLQAQKVFIEHTSAELLVPLDIPCPIDSGYVSNAEVSSPKLLDQQPSASQLRFHYERWNKSINPSTLFVTKEQVLHYCVQERSCQNLGPVLSRPLTGLEINGLRSQDELQESSIKTCWILQSVME